MTDRVYPEDGHIVMESDGVITWSTDRRPVNLLNESDWIDEDITISFPDFEKYIAYYLQYNPGSPFNTSSCASFAATVAGEWGPGPTTSGYVLAPQVIGTVPEGVNVLDVFVDLERTKAPTDYLSFPVDSLIPEGLTYLPGGSCICERTPGSVWTRGFEVYLDGTNVMLARYQSVYGDGSFIPDWRTDNDYSPALASAVGWTYSDVGSNSGMNGGAGRNSFILQRVDGRGEGGNINKRRGDANACSLTDTTDFSSTWEGRILVRPGIMGPDPTVPPDTKISYRGRDDLYGDGTTFTFKTLLSAGEYTVLCIAVQKRAEAGGPKSITGVTVNGVSATQLVTLGTYSPNVNNISAVYVIPTPASRLANIVVTTSGTMRLAGVGVFALDGVASLTPVATISGSGTSATSITTTPGGVLFYAHCLSGSSSPPAVGGIPHGIVKQLYEVGNPFASYAFGFMDTPSSSVSITPNGTASVQSWCAVSLA